MIGSRVTLLMCGLCWQLNVCLVMPRLSQAFAKVLATKPKNHFSSLVVGSGCNVEGKGC